MAGVHGNVNIDLVHSPNDALILNSSRFPLAFVKAANCSDPDATAASAEGKVIKAVLLWLKSGTSNPTFAPRTYGGLLAPANKKIKVASSTGNYNRMAVFGDLSDPPNCFVVFTDSGSESEKLFFSVINSVLIGTCFYLYEPVRTSKDHRERMNTIDVQKRFIPLKQSLPQVTLPEVVPQCPITIPSEADTYFFALHNSLITMARAIVLLDASCTGFACDRANPKDSIDAHCGCFRQHNSNKSAVLEVSVDIHGVPPEIRESRQLTIHHFRSLRTTKLLFHSFDDFCRAGPNQVQSREGEYRTSVDMMVDYVNDHDGWTLIGWCRKGRVDDASTPGETIQSEAPAFHLALLVPTSTEIRNLQDVHFNNLRIPTAPPTATPGNNIPAAQQHD